MSHFRNDIHVVMPFFNEDEVIESVLLDLEKYPYNIILVDDGSTRNIDKIISNFRLCYIKHKINLGQGAALSTGIKYALQKGAKYIVTFDADGQHRAEDIERLYEALGDNDVVFGSRFLNLSSNIPFARKIVLKTGCFIGYLVSGYYLTDSNNGLRLFTSQMAKNIQFTEARMAHAVELLWILKRHKAKIKEIPVKIIYNKYSLSKGQSILNSIVILKDIVLKKIFGV